MIEDLNIEVDARRIALESEAGPFQFLIKVWGCGKGDGGALAHPLVTGKGG